MIRETVRTSDAELYIGWPTTGDDLERDQSVQVGVRYGVDARWAVLTTPDQVDDLRRLLQRAKRRVWPDTAGRVEPLRGPIGHDPDKVTVTAQSVTVTAHSELA